MRTNATVAGASMVAVGTEKLKPRREVIHHEPRIHTIVTQLDALLVTAYRLNMVNRQELRFGFITTGAFAPIVFENRRDVRSVSGLLAP
jgi:hypothetical protein